MNLIKDLFRAIGEYKALVQTRDEMIKYEKARPVLASGLCDGAKFAFCACLCEDAGNGKPALIVCGDDTESLSLSALYIRSVIFRFQTSPALTNTSRSA